MIQVNGKPTEKAEGMLLADFLKSQGYDLTRIAVERNGEIVPKALYQTQVIQPEDALEVVGFVGGG